MLGLAGGDVARRRPAGSGIPTSRRRRSRPRRSAPRGSPDASTWTLNGASAAARRPPAGRGRRARRRRPGARSGSRRRASSPAPRRAARGTAPPTRDRWGTPRARGRSSRSRPAASRRPGRRARDHGENSRTWPHSRTAAPAESPRLQDQGAQPRGLGLGGGGEADGAGTDDDERHELMPRLYRSTSMVATIEYIDLDWPRDRLPHARRTLRGDVLRVVRRAGRPDPGPPAAHRVDLGTGRDARRRPRRRARHQPVDLLPPRAQARRGRLRDGRQGRHREHGVGQPRLLHRPPPRRRRRDGHAVRSLPCCPEDLPGRRHHPRDDRRRPRRRPRHLRRGRRHPQRHLRDRGTDGQGSSWQVAARPSLGRRARRAGSSAGPRSRRVSSATCYAGVGETTVYVAATARGRGVGKALLCTGRSTRPTRAASGPCRPRSSPRTAPRIALHHSAGYRTLAVRARIAQLDGVWRDTVLLERRRAG